MALADPVFLRSPSAAGKRVLDLACGNGTGTIRLGEVAASVVGVDSSRTAIETARASLSRPNVRYEHVTNARLPFDDGSFDLVVCLETLEHVRREAQTAFIDELRRVLTPGGVLVLSTPDRDVERAYELATGGFNPWHVHTPTRDEIDTLVSGFPNRVALREVDFIATVFGPEHSSRVPELELAVRDVRFPIAVLHACARDRESLTAFGTHPLGFRDEPRLVDVDAALDALPHRLRWVESRSEQALRIEAGLMPRFRPGSSSWWHTQTTYAFAERLARGRRVLDLGCGVGAGAARLAATAAEVVATCAPGETFAAARALHERPGLRFVAAPSLLPDESDGPFDLVICLDSEAGPDLLRPALERLAPEGVVIASRSMEGAPAAMLTGVDLVATAIVPEQPTSSTARVEELLPRRAASFRVHALSKSTAALDRVRETPPVACLRGDFQREALAMELYFAPRLHDLAGFGSEDRQDMLALRLARVEERLRVIEPRLDIAYQHRSLFAVRVWLNRIRRALRRTR